MTASSQVIKAMKRIGGFLLLQINWVADSTDGSFITTEIAGGLHHVLHRIITEPGSRVIANNPIIYEWTESPADSDEFYLTLIGGGDPGLAKPDFVVTNNTERTEGSTGSLTADQWDYADADTLGFSTIYYYGDPSAQAQGWIVLIEENTAPTDGYDPKLLDGNFAALGGSVFDNRDQSVAEFVEPKDSAGTIILDGLILYDRLLLEITGNSINSAQGTIKLLLEEIPEGRAVR